MADIQAPEVGAALRRFFNVYSDVPIRALDEVIYPVCIVGDVRVGGTKKSYGMANNTVAAGGAGTLAYVMLTNPLGSRTRIVLGTANVNANVQLKIARSGVFPASLLGAAFLTIPMAAPAVLRLDQSNLDNIGYGQTVLQSQSTGVIYDIGLILDPGDQCMFQQTVAATTLILNLTWSEEPVP